MAATTVASSAIAQTSAPNKMRSDPQRNTVGKSNNTPQPGAVGSEAGNNGNSMGGSNSPAGNSPNVQNGGARSGSGNSPGNR